jgi:hypothetical protein
MFNKTLQQLKITQKDMPLTIFFGRCFYETLSTFLKNLILNSFSHFEHTCGTHSLRYQGFAVMHYSGTHDVSTMGSTDS